MDAWQRGITMQRPDIERYEAMAARVREAAPGVEVTVG
jgi:hypothetical protein